MDTDSDETVLDGAEAAPARTEPILEENIPPIEGVRCEQYLGQGAAGAVFLVNQDKLSRRCALKVLHPHLGRERGFRSRFAREGRILAQMDHPNIVRVYDVGQKAGTYFLLLEYVDGGDLEQYLQRCGGRLEPDEVRKMLLEVLSALSYAHSQQIIHCDLKPLNILRTKDGRIKISDFGIAAVLGAAKFVETQTAHLGADSDATVVDSSGSGEARRPEGTPDYMAPEIRAGASPSVRSDFFALGVITYYLLTGRKPIGNYQRASKLRSGVHRRWDVFINQCLETDPVDRFTSAQQAIQVLKAIPSGGNSLFHRWPLVMLALAGVVGATAAWVAWRTAAKEPPSPVQGNSSTAVAPADDSTLMGPPTADVLTAPAGKPISDASSSPDAAASIFATSRQIEDALPYNSVYVSLDIVQQDKPVLRREFSSQESFGYRIRVSEDAYFVVLAYQNDEVRLVFPRNEFILPISNDKQMTSDEVPPTPPFGAGHLQIITATERRFLRDIMDIFPPQRQLKEQQFLHEFRSKLTQWSDNTDLRTGAATLHLNVTDK